MSYKYSAINLFLNMSSTSQGTKSYHRVKAAQVKVGVKGGQGGGGGVEEILALITTSVNGCVTPTCCSLGQGESRQFLSVFEMRLQNFMQRAVP